MPLKYVHAGLWKFFHQINNSKPVWLRALLSLLFGVTILYTTDRGYYDQRFQIRGTQEINNNILLLHISPSEWQTLGQQVGHPNTHLFQWQPSLWNKVLDKLQKGQPHSIGITFSFTNTNQDAKKDTEDLIEFDNTYWHTYEENGIPIHPYFLNKNSINFAMSYLHKDNDLFVRQHEFPDGEVTFLEKMVNKKARSADKIPLINFRGQKGRFKSIGLTDLLKNNYPEGLLKGKYILVGHSEEGGQVLLTPLGPMTRLEVLANVLDNILEDRWIQRLPRTFSILYLIGILILGVWIMSSYPQNIGLVFLFWGGTMSTALSTWTFDSFYFWVPTFAPNCLLAFTYIVFLSFQLTLKEKTNWLLEQGHKMQTESERLKSNFVSLISHDLKTPIAKIQAICDQLINQDLAEPHIRDLKNLRHESKELHQYIQSILKVSRIEAQDFKIQKEASDINEIIKHVTHDLQLIAKKKNITIEENLEPIFLIELDSTLIYEVILNVVENAIKYSDDDSKITVQTQEKNNQVEITVTDQGPGINKTDLKQIFNRFYRSPKQSSSTKGSGLGLYLVKYFIELHSGKVLLKSQENQGTQVQIYLPIQLQEVD